MKSDQYKTEHQYLSIDGNWTHHPMAYCTFHHGVLTQGLIDTHRCVQRNCARLRVGDVYE